MMESRYVRHVTIPAADGFGLAATYYEPEESAANGDAVLIASATGVKRGYYHKFARHLAEHGYRVLSFDYRGIGGSALTPEQAKAARMHQWGTLDIPAAQAWLEGEAKPARLLYVGHSVGGQILSLVPDNARFARVLLVCSQLGDFSLWPTWMRIGGWGLWNGVYPIAVMLTGHLPGWVIGGEPLPSGVAWEWRRWILSRGYLLAHRPEAQEGFERVTAPMLFYAFADDLKLGPIKPVRVLRGLYRNAPSEERYIAPRDMGVREIGHFGFFRSRFEGTFWKDALAFLAPDARDA